MRIQCVCGFSVWHYPHYDTERRWMRCVSCLRKDADEDQGETPDYVWIKVPANKRAKIAKENGLAILIPIR